MNWEEGTEKNQSKQNITLCVLYKKKQKQECEWLKQSTSIKYGIMFFKLFFFPINMFLFLIIF
jgi:hypothetical protein